MKTIVYLLRHAESVPSRELAHGDWPLSSRGQQQAAQLADYLNTLKVDQLFSSPFKRAMDTVTPFANSSSLKIAQIADLRERKLTEGFVDNIWEVMDRAWHDLAFRLPNCESGFECQQRIVNAVKHLANEHRGETLLISSHGNAIGLFLHSMDATFGIAEMRSMRMPDLFRINYEDESFSWDRGFTYSQM